MPKNSAWTALKERLKVVDEEIDGQALFVRGLQDKAERAKATLNKMRANKQEIKAAMDAIEVQP